MQLGANDIDSALALNIDVISRGVLMHSDDYTQYLYQFTGEDLDHIKLLVALVGTDKVWLTINAGVFVTRDAVGPAGSIVSAAAYNATKFNVVADVTAPTLVRTKVSVNAGNVLEIAFAFSEAVAKSSVNSSGILVGILGVNDVDILFELTSGTWAFNPFSPRDVTVQVSRSDYEVMLKFAAPYTLVIDYIALEPATLTDLNGNAIERTQRWETFNLSDAVANRTMYPVTTPVPPQGASPAPLADNADSSSSSSALLMTALPGACFLSVFVLSLFVF